MPGAKGALFGLYALLGLPAVVERATALGWSAALILYGGLLVLCWAGLILAAGIRPWVIRALLGVALAGAGMFLDAFERVSGDALIYDAFVNMLNSRAFADEALAAYGPAIVRALPAAVVLLAAFLWPPAARRRLPGWVHGVVPAAILLLVSGLFYLRGGDGGRGLPSPVVPTSYALLLQFDMWRNQAGSRQPVTLARGAVPTPRDIVLVIDESIIGTYLDINDAGGVHSGLSTAPPGVSIHNYGLAAAANNCSVGSNQVLRFGGRRDNYQRTIAVEPSIWAYARAAGLRTVYIDAQRTGGGLHNMMTPDERAEIDQFVQFDGVPIVERDHAAARRLVEFIDNDVAELILVNKVGGHFPIQDKYPEAMTVYRPALPRGSAVGDVSDTGDRDGFGGTVADWRRYRNSYRNTLLWNVGGFFDRLLRDADLDRATVIYTADHGQDLHEHGGTGVNTHCGTDPVMEEGVVPLVVLEGEGPGTLDWAAGAAAGHDRSSHFRIFPTLLLLMGYDEAAVRRLYGDPLTAPSDDPMSFNIRFNARLGRAPDYRRIDLAAIARPDPARDRDGPAEPSR